MPQDRSSREIVQSLEKDGWILRRIKGSHHIYKHPKKLGIVTITHPRKAIPIGTLRSIYRVAGWDWPNRTIE